MRDVAMIERPLFVYAGQNDPRVPRSESDVIVDTRNAIKKPYPHVFKLGAARPAGADEKVAIA